jgi:hypothetical protein
VWIGCRECLHLHMRFRVGDSNILVSNPELSRKVKLRSAFGCNRQLYMR